MTNCKPGDVVLREVVFTDQVGAKKRPAVVLSPASFGSRYGDAILIPLTSQQGDDALQVRHWSSAGLLKPTWVKPLIVTVSHRLIVKRLGHLVPSDEQPVCDALRLAIDVRWLR